MLKDITTKVHLILFLWSRKKLSFCHSCYTQISLASEVSVHLHCLSVAGLRDSLFSAFYRWMGEAPSCCFSCSASFTARSCNNLRGIQEKGQKWSLVTFGTLFIPLSHSLCIFDVSMSTLPKYTDRSEISWLKSSLGLTAAVGSGPVQQTRSI